MMNLPWQVKSWAAGSGKFTDFVSVGMLLVLAFMTFNL
ncbi:hypothetical protein LXEBMM8_EKPBGFGD_02717 [Lactiplantibacillus xiangfangensis]